MKTNHFIYAIFIIILSVSCDQDKKLLDQAIDVAEKYINGQLSDPQKQISKEGVIIISDKEKRYVIQPSAILMGFIDDDSRKDAIVPLAKFDGNFQTVSEQVILIKSGRELVIARTIESDMRIISLKDRIITADVPEHSRDNPLFNCQSCWEVVKYKFKKGELVKAE